jgi:hypothetical protein
MQLKSKKRFDFNVFENKKIPFQMNETGFLINNL